MAKQKKPLTTKQQQTKHRALQYTAIGGMFGSILTPFIILGAINFEDWFKTEGGWKIGLGATLGMAVVGIAVFLVTKKKEKESKVTDGWITFIVCWFAVAFIAKLFESIYSQIFEIMMWTGLGLCGAFGLDLVSKDQKRKADTIKEVRNETEKDSFKERIKKEYEKEQQPTE